METPARFTFSPDGNTKVFPIPVTMKGDNYVRIDINGVTINDRTKFDLVNNAVVLVDIADVPSGSQLDVLVVQTDEGIANLGTVNSIDTVATNIANINTVASNVTTVNTVATNIASVNNVATNIASVTDAVNQANAAAASAAAALVSENAAAASESAADASETAAAASAAAAATSASSSASSASAALVSETAAAASETAAAASETAAALSEINAATSEANAFMHEVNADNAAQAAIQSENAAQFHAMNAETFSIAANSSAVSAAGSAASASASQVAAAASAASAANSYDLFDDRYLGSFSVEPTLDNDGDPLVAGSLYFNSAVNEMRVYDGGNWIAASSAGGASLLKYEFTATSGQTVFSGADDNGASLSYTQDNILVFLNGVALDDVADYTATDGTSITLASGAALGDLLYVVAFKTFVTADMVSSSAGGTFYANVDVQAQLTVDALQFAGGTGTQGTLSWNADEETVDLIQDGATLQLGQEVQWHCRNNTGSTIPNGTPVMATGTLGTSGRITIAPMVSTTASNAKYFIGVTTEDILNDTDGKVTHFGKVRGIDTSALAEGSVLWLDPTTDGAFTVTKPVAGMKVACAFVINSHATNGTIAVRVGTAEEFNYELTQTITEAVYAISGTAVALEPDNGSVQTHTLTGNTTYTDAFSAGQAITLMIDDGTDYTITWPTMTWVNNGAAAPTLATSGYTVVALWKVSTTLYGALVGDGS